MTLTLPPHPYVFPECNETWRKPEFYETWRKQIVAVFPNAVWMPWDDCPVGTRVMYPEFHEDTYSNSSGPFSLLPYGAICTPGGRYSEDLIYDLIHEELVAVDAALEVANETSLPDLIERQRRALRDLETHRRTCGKLVGTYGLFDGSGCQGWWKVEGDDGWTRLAYPPALRRSLAQQPPQR